MSSQECQDDLKVNTAPSTARASATHPAGFAADPGLLVLKLAIDYLQKAQASGANVNTEAVRLQQLLAGLGAV